MSTPHGDTEALVEPTDLSAFIAQVQGHDVTPPRPVRESVRSPLVLVQPHPDDCALSIGGLLLRIPNPLQVVTVYSESATAESTSTRLAEDRRFAEMTAARWCHVGRPERRSGGAPRSAADIEAVTRSLRQTATGDSVVLAPAAVARHVDHRAVHQAALAWGGVVFWEDVAFWSIYGASIEDRVEFSLRSADWLADYVLVAVDITPVVPDKAALLACYPSQSNEVWRPLRYAWAAARELGRQGYCERLFVPSDQLDDHLGRLGLTSAPGPILTYGMAPVRTAWAVPR